MNWPRLIVLTASFVMILCFSVAADSDLAIPTHPDSDSLLARIDTLWVSGHRDSANAMTRSTITQARASGDSILLIDLLSRIGQQGCFFGRVAEAEAGLREAFDLAERLEEPARQRKALRWLGVAVGRQGRSSEADALYEDLFRRSQSAGDAYHEGWARVGLAWTAGREGRTEEQSEHYRRALELLRSVEDPEGEIWCLNALGNIHSSQGKLRKSRDCFQAAYELAGEKNIPLSQAGAFNDIGTIEYSLGDPGRALEMFVGARDIHETIGSMFQVITPMINIALCHNQMGRFAEAEKTLNQALEICRTQGYRSLERAVLANLALLNGRRGLRREAIRNYREVLESGSDLSLWDRAQCFEGLAENLFRIDSVGVAIEYLLEEEKLLVSGKGSVLFPRMHNRLGRCYSHLDQPEEALRHYRIGAEAAIRRGQIGEMPGLSYGEGVAHLALGQPDSALQAFARGVEFWGADRDLPLDPAWREQRASLGSDVHTWLAHVLLERMGESPNGERAREAFDRLQGYKARTLLERTLGPGEEFGRRVEAAKRELATLEDLQLGVLQPGELFLDYYLGADLSILFAATADSLRGVTLPGEEEIARRLKRYYQLVSRPPDRGSVTADPILVQDVAKAISEVLFTDIESLIEGAETILISTDGLIGLLPLHQIYADAFAENHEADDGRTKQWTRVPSASILTKVRRRGPGGPASSVRILALAGGRTPDGEVLHGSLQEVRSLGRRYADVDVRVDHAPGDSIASILDGPTVLHFATHLKVDNENPWQSEFQFREPGSLANLRAFEISTMELPARLAVLSSCASAGGMVLSGEGVIGVTSAFLSAGVPAVVATLWPVDDRTTALLMEEFYAALATGETAVAALHRSQAAIRSEPGTRHPFYWAGFVLVGDGDVTAPLETRFDPARYVGPIVIGALLLVLATGLLLAVRRNSMARAAH